MNETELLRADEKFPGKSCPPPEVVSLFHFQNYCYLQSHVTKE